MNTHLSLFFQHTLASLQTQGNIRQLPEVGHQGRWIETDGHRMLNLSSNDYLGLAADTTLQQTFFRALPESDCRFTSSSSRLLTGNFAAYTRLEQLLARLFDREAALVFSSGYHMNTGILPAVADAHTLILADKLVHASIIDGIRLSAARCIRFPHQDYGQLERLLALHHTTFQRIIVVTESIFSMDGDIAPLARLVELKKKFDNVMLYVDEAHAIGTRGRTGLGIAEEQSCLHDIDFLCGTFGKAMASVGAYLVCDRVIKEFLVNRMRTLIFTTALPPINIAWTCFILEQLADMNEQRQRLDERSRQLRKAIRARGTACVSGSHIVPYVVGTSPDTILKAEDMQRKGFYVLPVRPPTVPEGTSRLRFSLTANLTEAEIKALIQSL